jgi:hypothetical protein
MIPIATCVKKKKIGQKLISGQEGMKKKEKRLFYFGLRIRLPIKIQLLEIDSPKNPKVDSPYCRVSL